MKITLFEKNQCFIRTIYLDTNPRKQSSPYYRKYPA
jgi:hypothetical protein